MGPSPVRELFPIREQDAGRIDSQLLYETLPPDYADVVRSQVHSSAI